MLKSRINLRDIVAITDDQDKYGFGGYLKEILSLMLEVLK